MKTKILISLFLITLFQMILNSCGDSKATTANVTASSSIVEDEVKIWEYNHPTNCAMESSLVSPIDGFGFAGQHCIAYVQVIKVTTSLYCLSYEEVSTNGMMRGHSRCFRSNTIHVVDYPLVNDGILKVIRMTLDLTSTAPTIQFNVDEKFWIDATEYIPKVIPLTLQD